MELGAKCGMSESEFWDSTPRYMSAKIRALEAAQQLTWEQARFVAFFGSRATAKSILSFWRFPWEKAVFIKQSREELDAFSDDADEVLKVMNPGAYEAYMAGKQKSTNGAELFSGY